jgi:hypothetical protein
MSKKQKALLACQIFCAFILAILPFIGPSAISRYPQDDFRHYAINVLFNYRVYFVIVCGLVVAVVPAIKDIFYPRRQQKEMRAKIMDTMMEELFKGDRQNVRITVFKDANGLRHLWIYLILLWKKARSWKLPWPPWGKYIYARERQGTEFPLSRTFFHYSKHTRKRCQGVAGIVRQSEEEVILKGLPDLENIDLSQIDMSKKRTADVRLVREYMDKAHLRDFETLKRVHKPARHLCGNILQNRKGAVKGVLVIDSWQDNCPFDDESVMKRLSYYLTLFAPTM